MSALSELLALESFNTLDRFRVVGCQVEATDEEHFYCLFQLKIPDGLPVLLSDYILKVSVWNTVNSRQSRDVQLDCSSEAIVLFKLLQANIPGGSQTYFYVDLVHRDSAVSIASGSAVINPEGATSGARSPSRSATASVVALDSRPLTLQSASIELNLTNNFKHWTVPADLSTLYPSTGRSIISLDANVGCILANGRVNGSSHMVTNPDRSDAPVVIVVPAFQPTLYDCLLSTAAPNTASDSLLDPPTGTEDARSSPLATRLTQSVWHASVEDLQLTSDILDLYADRSVLVTAACGGAASLAPHSYLGNIRHYQGNYVEKAEISLISATSSSLLSAAAAGVYRSCLSFEVKVMEATEVGGRDDTASRRPGASGVGTVLDTCVLCTGVLQHAQKVAELDGSAPRDLPFKAARHSSQSEGDVLTPPALTSGFYEVLLYTVYNPDSEIETTLVGKLVVALYVPELNIRALDTASATVMKLDETTFREDGTMPAATAMATWLQRFEACCAKVAPTASAPSQSVEVHVQALSELGALLRMLVTPDLAEATVHDLIVSLLQRTSGGDGAKTCVIPALQDYFQEWLASDALATLMTPPSATSTTEFAATGTGSAPSSPMRPASPTWGTGSVAVSPLKPGAATSPGSKSSGRKTLRPGAGAGARIRSAYDDTDDLPWQQIEAAAVCLRLLKGLLPDHSAGAANDDSTVSETDEALDAHALVEMGQDLAAAMLRQTAHLVKAWRIWYAEHRDNVTNRKGLVKLGQDALDRLQRGVYAVCLLLTGAPNVGAETQQALLSLCAEVRNFAGDIASAAAIEDAHDAGAEEEWRGWMAEHMADTLSRLFRLVAKFTVPNNDATGALPACVEHVLQALGALHEVGLVPASRWGLLITLTETVCLFSSRLSRRLESFAVTEVVTDALYGQGYTLSLWGKSAQQIEEERPPVVKIAEPPTSAARKAARRASALTMFGIDATQSAGPSPQSPMQSAGSIWDLNSVSPAPAEDAFSFSGLGGTGGGVGAAAVLEEEEQKRNMLDVRETYAEESVLYFLHENAAFVRCVQATVSCLQALQDGNGTETANGVSSPSAAQQKHRMCGNGRAVTLPQQVVGVVTALQVVLDLVDSLANALLRGRVLNPELLQELIRSAADSNGIPGKGLALFIDLYSWAQEVFFASLCGASTSFKQAEDPELLNAVAHRMHLAVAYHAAFYEVLLTSARSDRYINRAAWLAYAAAGPAGRDSSPRKPAFGSASSAPQGATGTSLGGSALATAFLSGPRNRRFEDFTAAGSLAVGRWLTARAGLADTLHGMCVCAVHLARQYDEHRVQAETDPGPLSEPLRVAFAHAVVLLCRSALMVDVGSQAREMQCAIISHAPLHVSLQQLFRLAESIPVSLQRSAAAGASYGTYESGEGALPDPLGTLLTTMLEAVNFELSLSSTAAVHPRLPAANSGSPTISALAQLLDHLTIANIHHSREDALFSIKLLLRGRICEYLPVREDPALSAQPVIKFRSPGEVREAPPRRALPESAFPRAVADTVLTAQTALWSAAGLFEHFQREYAMHLTAVKLLLCSRHTIVNGDNQLHGAPQRHLLLRNMFEKCFFSASVANMLAYGVQYGNCTDANSSGDSVNNATDGKGYTECAQSVVTTCDHLLAMVDTLSHVFNPDVDGHSTGGSASSSELLSVFGCSFKAHHDILRLLLHVYRNAALPLALTAPSGGDALASTPVQAMTPTKQPSASVGGAGMSAAQSTLSEASKRLETEILHLRHCLQWLLRSGQWEIGLELATVYQEKFKLAAIVARKEEAILGLGGASQTLAPTQGIASMVTPTRTAVTISTPKDGFQGSPMRAPFSPQASASSRLSPAFNFNLTETPRQSRSPGADRRIPLPAGLGSPSGVAHTAASHAKRYDTMKSELSRVIDTMQSRIHSDDALRLHPHYYAVLFVSDRPWEEHTGNDMLTAALKHIDTDRLRNFSASWLHSRNAESDEGTANDAAGHTGLYEYWLVLKFDATSYPICADFYDDILFQDQMRRSEGQPGLDADLSLLSPISYHNIQAQLAMAFPAFSMVTSHHQIENYFGEHHSHNHAYSGMVNEWGEAEDVEQKLPTGSVNYMQLFEAFPAEVCEDAYGEAVTGAVQAIVDAKTAASTVTEDNLLEDGQLNLLKDGADLTAEGADDEQKQPEGRRVTTAPGASRDALLQRALANYPFAAPCATKFYAYTLLSEDQLTVMNDQAQGQEMAESSAYIYRYELHISGSTIDYTVLGSSPRSSAAKAATVPPPSPPPPPPSNSPMKSRSMFDKDGFSDTASRLGEFRRAASGTGNTPAVNKSEVQAPRRFMNSFCVSPVNLAVHSDSARRTPIQASIEILYHHSVQLRRALSALEKLNEFTKAELLNERVGDVISSDSIVAGVFTLLSNLLTMPSANCCAFPNMETIIASEQERIDLEWQAERKEARTAYLRAVTEYEEEKEREEKKWKKLMKPKPAELDLDALKEAFYAQPTHAGLRTLQTLHDEAQLLVWRTLKELRKFIMAKDDQAQQRHPLSPEELRQLAMKRGRRPSVTSMVLQGNIVNHISKTMDATDSDGQGDTEKSLKMKLCLYLESLFGAMEVGIPL